MTIGGTAFHVALEFTYDRLTAVHLGAPLTVADAPACKARMLRTLNALEVAGPFVGARAGMEPDSAPVEARTERGSVIRGYAANDTGSTGVFANRPGSIYTEVSSGFSAEPSTQPDARPSGSCVVMVDFADERPLPMPAIDAPSAEELEAAPMATGVTFIEQPDGQSYARVYPPAAIRNGVEGRAMLECLVGETGYLRCAVTEDSPEGAGFGDAALRVSTEFRVAPTQADGAPTAGRRLRRTIVFRLGS